MIWLSEQVAVSGEEISENNWAVLTARSGFTAVVNLRHEYQDVFSSPLPVAYLWLPVTDFTDPTLEQLFMGSQFIDTAVRAGNKVLIHCKLGIGRSPTLAAAYLVWTGCPVDEALRIIKERSAGISQPIVDHRTLHEFASFLDEKASFG